MAILVSHTSVLIELERAGLLDSMFLLPFEFGVPDLLYERELVGELGETVVQLGSRVETLTVAKPLPKWQKFANIG